MYLAADFLEQRKNRFIIFVQDLRPLAQSKDSGVKFTKYLKRRKQSMPSQKITIYKSRQKQRGKKTTANTTQPESNP